LLQSGRRKSTVSTYTTGLNNFIFFLSRNALLQASTLNEYFLAIPEVSTSLFGHYLTWMYQCMYAFNTIKSYTTAVKMWCRANRRLDPTIDPVSELPDIAVTDVWQAIKRLSKKAERRFAVTFAQLEATCRSCSNKSDLDRAGFPSELVARNVAAATCLAWFGLLRGSEYTTDTTTTFNLQIHACRGDIKFVPDIQDPLYIQFTVKNCKTDNIDRRGFVSTIYRNTKRDKFGRTSNVCAVMRLRHLFLTDPLPATDPLFRFNNPINHGARTPASIRPRSRDSSHRTMTKLFSKLLVLNDYNDEKISSHSFRRGGATALFRTGASEYMVMQAGRWQSSCWKLYVETDHTFYAGFASQMAQDTTAGVRWDADTVPTFVR
jgi:hypothetical protein